MMETELIFVMLNANFYRDDCRLKRMSSPKTVDPIKIRTSIAMLFISWVSGS